jgi:NitT/TauT family transport system permease protein
MSAQSDSLPDLAPPVVPAPEQEVRSLRLATLRRQLLVNALRVLFVVVIVGGWELGGRTKVIDAFFWGQPSGIWAQIRTWITEGTAQGPLWKQVLVTLQEALYGFVIGVTLGIVFGVILGSNRFLSDVLGPFIKAANSIPRVVLGSIFVIGFGYGIQSKVALSVVLVFFIVFFNAFQGVREVDRNLLANARILGANRRQLTAGVTIPAALTWIIASLHTSFSFALVGAVVGEYLGSLEGIGLMIQTAQANFNANGVFAAMVILAVVALTAEALITWLENRLIRWRPNTTTEATL